MRKSVEKMPVHLQNFLGAYAKLRKATIRSSCPFVRPYGTTRLPLDGFSRILMIGYFSKICRENSTFIKIWQG